MGDEETMEDLAGHVEEEEAKQENLTQQTQYSPDQQMLIIKQETFTGRRNMDFVLFQLRKELLELSLEKKRPRKKKGGKDIAAHQRERRQHMKMLEFIKERRVHDLEEILNRNYKMIEDDRTLFEEEGKSNPERNATVKKLTNELGDIKSEFEKTEKVFNNCKIYKETLLPPELQEAQQAEALKAQVSSHRDVQDEQSRAPQESEVRQGLDSSPDRVLPESTLSAVINGKLDKNSKVDHDSTEHEEKLVPYISNSQQPLDVATEVREQSLSLIQNSTRVDETLEEVEQILDTVANKIKEMQEKVILRENEKTERRNKERVDAAWLKKTVQLHESLKTEDKDVLLGTLGSKVKEVYARCMDSRLHHLNTLEKLSSVEYRMCSLLQLIESMPADCLEKQRQIKEKERRNRLLEENLRLEEEKRRERRKKCLQRSLGDSVKNTRRKLMPRCIPAEKQKTKVCNEEDIPVEDELYAYLFENEDSD